MKVLTDAKFWDKTLSTKSFPSRMSRADREYMGIFRDLLRNDIKDTNLLEVGCGCSYWLPYFASLGATVYGIDFSSSRLEQARQNLEAQGMTGRLRCIDFQDPPPDWIGKFDLVFSAGVAEHFDPPTAAVRSMAVYLKPGGVMITTVPHLDSIYGRLAKRLNPEAARGYINMDLGMLESAHQGAQLSILSGEYTRPLDLGVLNFSKLTWLDRKAAYLVATLLGMIPMPTLPDSLCADMVVVATKGTV